MLLLYRWADVTYCQVFNSVLSSIILYTKVSVTFISVGVVGVGKSVRPRNNKIKLISNLCKQKSWLLVKEKILLTDLFDHLDLWSWGHLLVRGVTVNQFKQICTLYNVFFVLYIQLLLCYVANVEVNLSVSPNLL